ncbi:MAG TPA: hypothetical protein O0X23_03230 [Methanocorpusculum sp.]|nr:hypothetical protein [Methanocorpusculum sp.]
MISVTAPAVSAKPAFVAAAPAIPAVVDIVVSGAAVTVATAEDIGSHLKKTWDGTVENLNKFASDMGAALSNLFSAKNWKYATSHKSVAMLEFEYFEYLSSGGSKPDDKWYHIK